MKVKPCSVDEFFSYPNLDVLFEEYRAEADRGKYGRPSVQVDMYKSLEDVGMLKAIIAEKDGALVGFIALLVSVVPHFGKTIATTESFFVTEPGRKHGIGIKLLKRAEEEAKGAGAVMFYSTAPIGGRLEKLLPHFGFERTNIVFGKRLSDG